MYEIKLNSNKFCETAMSHRKVLEVVTTTHCSMLCFNTPKLGYHNLRLAKTLASACNVAL